MEIDLGGERLELRPTIECPGWWASKDGRIFSSRGRSYRELKAAVAGPPGRGRLKIRTIIDGRARSFAVHKLVFHAWRGRVPAGLEIDHRDRNPLNNAIENMRLTTRSGNNANRATKPRSMPRGVHKSNSKAKPYCAYIGAQYLGSFASPACASATYRIHFFAKHGHDAAALPPPN